MSRDKAVDGWITWRRASELTGIPVPTIEHAVRVGRIARRDGHGSRPTLDRASVEEWAGSYTRQQAGARMRSASAPSGTKRIVRPFRESVDQQWLTTSEAAAVMDVCEDTCGAWRAGGNWSAAVMSAGWSIVTP